MVTEYPERKLEIKYGHGIHGKTNPVLTLSQTSSKFRGVFYVFVTPTGDWIGVLLNYNYIVVWLRCHKSTAKYFLI